MITIHYPVPETLEDLVYYSQLNQADAMKHGVEHFRRIKKGAVGDHLSGSSTTAGPCNPGR